MCWPTVYWFTINVLHPIKFDWMEWLFVYFARLCYLLDHTCPPTNYATWFTTTIYLVESRMSFKMHYWLEQLGLLDQVYLPTCLPACLTGMDLKYITTNNSVLTFSLIGVGMACVWLVGVYYHLSIGWNIHYTSHITPSHHHTITPSHVPNKQRRWQNMYRASS